MAIKIANVVLPRLVNTLDADDVVIQVIGNNDNEIPASPGIFRPQRQKS